MVNLRANVQGLKLSQDSRDAPETVDITVFPTPAETGYTGFTGYTVAVRDDIIFLTRTSMFV